MVSFCAMALLSLVSGGSAAGELVLAEGGRSPYQIVVADDASLSTKHGAEELQTFLEEISGAKLPIVSDRQPATPREIVIGDNARLRAIVPEIDLKPLGPEGYIIRVVGERLIVAGGALRGNMYGVYGFLEDHLGCRWFAPGVSRIPKRTRLTVGPIDERQVPVLEYRAPFVFECFDGDWCARNRMNSNAARLGEKHGGKVKFADGFFCHTFNRLVPPEKYFDDHPEYFSMVKGKRQRDRSQLCCTNPDVVRICTETIRAAMRAQPEAAVFSVSHNDWYNYCECPACSELARREGSQIAPVLQLVNSVAEAVEKEFPDKIVETLAYQWTRRPPKTIRPRPNVVIRLCSIECCFSHPLETCDGEQNRAFRADVETWSKIAPRLWVWDYATDFKHYLLPFPNQRVRGPNVRFFVAHNVKGIMEQDTYNTPDSELAALGGYISAKCLWNPNYDPETAMNEFLEGYYGRAAEPIRTYIDLLHDRVERENIHVNIWAECNSPHLTDELLIEANECWRQAENLAADDPATLNRVKLSRMSVDYAILERGRLQAAEKLPLNERFAALAAARFGPFFETLDRSALTRLHEWKLLDKKAYRRELADNLGLSEK
ncbi:MAG: DUF4838 domain-containing protein [Pirellulaceae bacterium]|nr:DUF4838 domain-containing protein [Pirellulaceae bacterium]